MAAQYTCGLVEIDVDPLQLQIRVSVVASSWIHSMPHLFIKDEH